MGTWFSMIQIPILVALLYFLFSMPCVNKLFKKYLSFLPLYNEDGNINFMGRTIKSVVFAVLYYSMEWSSWKISTL